MTEYFRDAVFWAAVACCVVATVAILRATVVSAAASAGARGRRLAEVAYAVVPALALAAVLVATWPRVRDARLAAAARTARPAPVVPAVR